jgi:hypothetical protein
MLTMERPLNRAAIAAVSAALVGTVCAALAPAQAQQAAAKIGEMLGVVTCHSSSPCVGGVNTGTSFGVLAVASKNNGIDAATKNPSKTNNPRSGVYGHDDSTDGGTGNVGVAGSSTYGTGMEASSAFGKGLIVNSAHNTGIVSNASLAGVFGSGFNGVDGYNGDGNTSGVGTYGYSLAGTALLGVAASGNRTQALELHAGTADGSGAAIKTFDSNSVPIFVVDNLGNVGITGLLYTGGPCGSGCSKTRRVTEYAPRESMPTMEDVGEGQLVGGKAYVPLDPAFANVIDQRATYFVFVSPEGSSQGLYVTRKTALGFDVVENQGGHATIPFGYRIIAKPFGVTAARLPMLLQSQKPAPARPQAGVAAMARLAH